MNFIKSLFLSVEKICIFVLSLIVVVFGIYIYILGTKIKNYQSEILTLKVQNKECELNLIKQNTAILALKNEISSKNINSDKIEEVKKIYIKDSSCEAELKAYKELFK